MVPWHVTEVTRVETGDCELRQGEDGLELIGNGMVLRADFMRLLPRLRPDRLGRELLVRAARVRGVASPTVVDATAGFGEDSLLLAAAGFTVDLYEQDCVIAALLQAMPWIARQMNRQLATGRGAHAAYMRARIALSVFAIQLS